MSSYIQGVIPIEQVHQDWANEAMSDGEALDCLLQGWLDVNDSAMCKDIIDSDKYKDMSDGSVLEEVFIKYNKYREE